MALTRQQLVSLVKRIQFADYKNEKERADLFILLENETKNDNIVEYFINRKYDEHEPEEILDLIMGDSESDARS